MLIKVQEKSDGCIIFSDINDCELKVSYDPYREIQTLYYIRDITTCAWMPESKLDKLIELSAIVKKYFDENNLLYCVKNVYTDKYEEIVRYANQILMEQAIKLLKEGKDIEYDDRDLIESVIIYRRDEPYIEVKFDVNFWLSYSKKEG